MFQGIVAAVVARFRHYLIDDRGTYERLTWSKSTDSPILSYAYNFMTSTLDLYVHNCCLCTRDIASMHERDPA